MNKGMIAAGVACVVLCGLVLGVMAGAGNERAVGPAHEATAPVERLAAAMAYGA